jgi:nitrogen fixation/metabolism regulation signal transduction histidine kinase
MKFESKLLCVFVFVLMIIMGIFLITGIYDNKKLEKQFEESINSISRTVHFSTSKLSKERGIDRVELENFVTEAKKNKFIKEISVVNNEQEVVASSNPGQIGKQKEMFGSEIVVREELGSNNPSDYHDHIQYEIKIPLLRENKVIGLVQTTLYLPDLRMIIRQNYFHNIFISFISLFCGFIIVFIALRRLNRPLVRLTNAAQKVADGDLNVSLEMKNNDEIGILTQSFIKMAGKIAEYRQTVSRIQELERRSILAGISSSLAHEVKNPLNLISLTSDHLNTLYQPEDISKRKTYNELITTLKAEVKHLDKMVNALLAIGKPLKLQPAVFSLNDLYEQLNILLRYKLSSQSILFEFPDNDFLIFADMEQIRLVLLNLVLNSIQSIGGNGLIRITHYKYEESIEIHVSDNGKGIEPALLEKIFMPYFTTKPDGIGIGLTSARQIVEEHNGKIHAENKDPKGAVFIIQLPIERLR